jgi:hypothetical protein
LNNPLTSRLFEALSRIKLETNSAVETCGGSATTATQLDPPERSINPFIS